MSTNTDASDVVHAARPAEKMSEYYGRVRCDVIGVPIDAIDWPTARKVLLGWASTRQSRYVCICNVHSVVTAGSDDTFRDAIEQADMATPDGAPVAWTLGKKRSRTQERINGPDLMWKLFGDAEVAGVSIGLHGSTVETLALLQKRLAREFPKLKIAYSASPPFRSLSREEDDAIVSAINRSEAGLLFVGLGCPKQEKWMAAHRGCIDAVMLGVGAAFDFHAGTVSRAPAWMRSNGLEWLHRLLSEPRRLWKRYLVTNSVFLICTSVEWLRGRFHCRTIERSR